MKSILKIFVAFTMMLSTTMLFSQTKNLKTENVKIYGNCGMCKSTIEEAGNLKKIAKVEWDKDSKMATLTFDSKKTSKEEILKRIALAGYDNEQFLAPDDLYSKLPASYQYERTLKPITKSKDAGMDMKNEHENHDHSEMVQANTATTQNISQLEAV